MIQTYDDEHGPDTDESWKPIGTFNLRNKTKVSIWIHIYASPRSMGMSDGFEVPDAWREGNKWFHLYEGKKTEIFGEYVTHYRAPK